jgi:cystathionine beta-synthase
VDFGVIDYMEKVTDRDGAVMARRIAREEGILLGYSAGSAIAGLHQLKDRLTKDDVVVVIFHDHGSRYVAKIYNDEWMRERGFLDWELKVKDLIASKEDKTFFAVKPTDTVRYAFNIMREHDLSQMPVMDNGDMVGSITESDVLKFLLENPMQHTEKTVDIVMGKPFPIVEEDLPFRQLSKYLNKNIHAVVARDRAGQLHVLTEYDVIQAV